MANLIVCKSCGKEIAKTAKSCPHCGAPNKQTSVLLVVLLGVVIAPIVFGAIFRSNDQKAAPPKPPESASAKAAPLDRIYRTTVQKLNSDYETNEVAADEK